MESIKIDETLIANLQPPRFENGKPLLIGGLGERYICETSAGMSAQWQRFLPRMGNIPGQVGRRAYGVRCNGDDVGITYADVGLDRAQELQELFGATSRWTTIYEGL